MWSKEGQKRRADERVKRGKGCRRGMTEGGTGTINHAFPGASDPAWTFDGDQTGSVSVPVKKENIKPVSVARNTHTHTHTHARVPACACVLVIHPDR